MSRDSGNTAGRLLLRRIPRGSSGKEFFSSYVVTQADEANLQLATKDDSCHYLYNGVLSFLGALSALAKQQSAWAVTKLYYSAFYTARASLCRSGHLIFHVAKPNGSGYSQYELNVKAGGRPSTSNIPSTHKLVLARFETLSYPTFLQGLILDGLSPLAWLMEQREFWQYRAGRFSDPDFPDCLSQIDSRRLQQILTAYQEDERGLYLADPDHALVAIPFRLLLWSFAIAPLTSTQIGNQEMEYVRKSCLVGTQHLTSLSRYFQN